MKLKNDKDKKTIAVDFDGVIHKYSDGWRTGTIYDEPISGVKASIITLAKKYNIVIFSRRTTEQGSRRIAIWLNKHNIPYSEITGEKPRAKWYIDDQAIHFDNWKQTLKELNRLDKEYEKNKKNKEGFPGNSKNKKTA